MQVGSPAFKWESHNIVDMRVYNTVKSIVLLNMPFWVEGRLCACILQ